MTDVGLKKRGVYLGRVGETGRYRVWMDVSEWEDEYSGGTGLFLLTNPEGTVLPMATSVETDEDGTKMYGMVTDTETAIAGVCVIEATWQSGGVLAKSEHYNGLVLEATYTGETTPDSTPSWVRELITELSATGVLLDEAAAVQEIYEAIDEAMENAEQAAEDAEAWAVGERGGEPVPEGDDTCNNNSKYYATQAAGSAGAAAVSAQNAFSGTPEGYAALVSNVGRMTVDMGMLPRETDNTFAACRFICVEEEGFFIIDENNNIGYEIDDISVLQRNNDGTLKPPVYTVNGVSPDSDGNAIDVTINEIVVVDEPGLMFVDDTLHIGYVFDEAALRYAGEAHTEHERTHTLSGTWCSIGTSITWYNDHPTGNLTRGYQSRVMDVIDVETLYNVGWNGGTIVNFAQNTDRIVLADWYTIEHGINDWGHSTPVGTREDYVNNTGAGTFYGSYRIVIDRIYQLNANAKIILCTPRKGYGFNGFLPNSSEQPLNGIYLYEYANAVKTIAEIESLPVCDFFGGTGMNDRNLRSYSIDEALHPNDAGMQIMADKLIKTIVATL